MSKYLNFTGLQKYDELIKQYVTNADTVVNARSIKTVLVDGDYIKFFKKENATLEDTADYSVAISSSDVVALKAAVEALNTAVGKGEDGALIPVATTAENAAKAVQGDTTSTIKKVEDDLATAKEDLTVKLGTAETATEGYLKTYVISQGSAEIGKIDIPKDLVVTSGEVVTNPEGQPEGTYIKLTIANQDEPIYINVKDLIDIYTAAEGAAQVQLAISDRNVISATIVAGSIGTTELADSAVTTAKIADANVTKAKLAKDVQATLDLADNSVQKGAKSVTQSIDVNGLELTVAVGEDGTLSSVSGEINTITEAEITALFTTVE